MRSGPWPRWTSAPGRCCAGPKRCRGNSSRACTGSCVKSGRCRRRRTMTNWDPPGDKPGLERVRVGDVDLKPGDRVRLWPLGRADILDLALEGKTATIAAIEQDFEDRIYLAVTVDDDP